MSTEIVQDVLNFKALEAQMMKSHDTLEGFIKKHNEETKAAGSASVETKQAIDKVAEKTTTLADRLFALEQAQAQHFDGGEEVKSIGDRFVECEEFKRFAAQGRGHAKLDIKTAIVNAAPSMTQPLTAGTRLNTVIAEPNRALRIRDLLPSGNTDSNIVWYPKENAWTNNAAVQVGGSPTIVAENVSLAESALTFTSASAEVKTIGHFIPISLQALADSSFLSGYVNSRLLYGLGFKVDTELLTGAGTLGTITGIYTGRTAYAMDSPLSYTTKLDVLRDAKAQAHADNYEPDFVVLNPQNWADIELTKETYGMYVYANPASQVPMTIWGMRVVLSNSMTAGTFLVGSSRGAQVWNRQQAAVSISYEEGNNFTKEMATLKATERLALTIYNAKAFRGGSFTVT